MAAEVSDDDWEEESMILVELAGVVDQNWVDYFTNTARNVRLLGIDTENPVLQVERYIFTGQYQDTVGTAVLFEDEKDGDENDEDRTPRLKHSCCTHKVLAMNRCFLEDKEDAPHGEELPSTSKAGKPLETLHEEDESIAMATSSGKDTDLENATVQAKKLPRELHEAMMSLSEPMDTTMDSTLNSSMDADTAMDMVAETTIETTLNTTMHNRTDTTMDTTAMDTSVNATKDTINNTTQDNIMDTVVDTPEPSQSTSSRVTDTEKLQAKLDINESVDLESVKDKSEEHDLSPEIRPPKKDKGGRIKNRNRRTQEPKSKEPDRPLFVKFPFQTSTPSKSAHQKHSMAASQAKTLVPGSSKISKPDVKRNDIEAATKPTESTAKTKTPLENNIRKVPSSVDTNKESASETTSTPATNAPKSKRVANRRQSSKDRRSVDSESKTPTAESSSRKSLAGKLDLNSAIMSIVSGKFDADQKDSGDTVKSSTGDTVKSSTGDTVKSSTGDTVKSSIGDTAKSSTSVKTDSIVSEDTNQAATDKNNEARKRTESESSVKTPKTVVRKGLKTSQKILAKASKGIVQETQAARSKDRLVVTAEIHNPPVSKSEQITPSSKTSKGKLPDGYDQTESLESSEPSRSKSKHKQRSQASSNTVATESSQESDSETMETSAKDVSTRPISEPKEKKSGSRSKRDSKKSSDTQPVVKLNAVCSSKQRSKNESKHKSTKTKDDKPKQTTKITEFFSYKTSNQSEEISDEKPKRSYHSLAKELKELGVDTDSEDLFSSGDEHKKTSYTLSKEMRSLGLDVPDSSSRRSSRTKEKPRTLRSGETSKAAEKFKSPSLLIASDRLKSPIRSKSKDGDRVKSQPLTKSPPRSHSKDSERLKSSSSLKTVATPPTSRRSLRNAHTAEPMDTDEAR